ncbi:hypothetical protein [Ruminococcus gauvreauii]|uniref:Uncharacterized protein n=1 Tax=Ruminococcus gauvreauii TaxID=438033 RepID=A0ABY5VFZ3_9FIRM|nr:hypothetical protein [Ruminococcus gauvreauii]UWP59071.1 hypothetical protein NQ502_17150 [Ruminococcus gauvreauii]
MQKKAKLGGVVLPVVIDTLPGREMRISYIDRRNYYDPKSNQRPYLLSPEHLDKMKELPY